MERKKLISFRKARGFTQKDVVSKLKEESNVIISESYYGMIEMGVRTSRLEVALAIAKLFDTTLEEIFLG